MTSDTVPQLLMLAAGLYFAGLWWADYRAAAAGSPAPQPYPGAETAPRRALVVAVLGSLVILAAETLGEIALGVDGEQSKMTALFAAYSLVAAFVEEIIFRGYLVVEKRGRAALVAGVFGASLLFALIHPFLWKWDDGFALNLTPKGWLSFAAVFVGSLWFYHCRFASWNPRRSLLPCFAAHFAKNAGVIVIKGVQGHLAGLW